MTTKLTLWAIGVIVFFGAAFVLLNSYIYQEKQSTTSAGYKNIEYVIEGELVKLVDGVAEAEAVPGSAAKVVTKYFGNELVVDLNNDGQDDVVFYLTQESAGSGTFYYVVAALATENGYVGSEAYFIGDRIAPNGIELSQDPGYKNVIVANYVERAPGEPMSVQPSVGQSVWLKLDPESLQFGVVEGAFEGEADAAFMSLTMKEWIWVSALYNDGRVVEPNEVGDFTISFTEDGRFSATTDCNSLGGSYTASEGSISFDQMVMTKMFCPDSQESEFISLLENTALYHFTSQGQLIFDLKFDSGTVTFR